jgi:hypothetical protein
MDLGAPVGVTPTRSGAISPVGIPAQQVQAASAPSTATAPNDVRLPDYHAQQFNQPPRPDYPIPLHKQAHEPLPDLPPVYEPAFSNESRTVRPVDLPRTHPAHPSNGAPTSSIDPNTPSDQSAPTALPTNPTTHPDEQRRAMQNEHPAVVAREIEKTKAEEREIKGERPLGTVVSGIEDDRLWQMLRRFDVVSAYQSCLKGH